MLRSRSDFEALGRLGTSRGNRLLVFRWRRTERPETRIGLSTPRSLGGAVERNRVRRRLRELVRHSYEGLGPGWDVLVVARPDAAAASWDELREAFASLLRRASMGR
jgi:ribonuclease P protein component